MPRADDDGAAPARGIVGVSTPASDRKATRFCAFATAAAEGSSAAIAMSAYAHFQSLPGELWPTYQMSPRSGHDDSKVVFRSTPEANYALFLNALAGIEDDAEIEDYSQEGMRLLLEALEKFRSEYRTRYGS
jgi:hypothetical protein